MVKDIMTLIRLCELELEQREYETGNHKKISRSWMDLKKWMDKNAYLNFDEHVGFKFCDEYFGGHDFSVPIIQKNRIGLRAIRMLVSYQRDGDFEFRTPSVSREFFGTTGESMEIYLNHLENFAMLKANTLSNKRYYLHLFNKFLELRQLTFNDMEMIHLAEFFQSQSTSLASRHNCSSTLRLLLKYLYHKGMTQQDKSFYIMPDNYKRSRKLPTTYEESEIRSVIDAVERGSAIGKRDYLVILLAAEYGWRSSDIVNLTFKQIDWDKNIIQFKQQKTEFDVTYPLIASIGNAIIDYLKSGRPDTNANEIIVSHESSNKGKKLNKVTIHSIVNISLLKHHQFHNLSIINTLLQHHLY